MSAAIVGAVAGGAIISGGLGLIGAGTEANAQEQAAQTQAQAAEQAAQLQYQEFQQQETNQAPWLAAGAAALPQLSSMAANPVSFTAQDFQNNMDPAYQFDLNQGLKSIQSSAAAQGDLLGGNTLQGITNYAEGSASNEYQNAYSRFMNNQNTQFNRLSSVAGIGQTANSALGQAGQSMAGNVGNIGMSSANAQGAATIGSANAWGGALNNIGSTVNNGVNNWQTLSYLNRMNPGGMGGGAGVAGYAGGGAGGAAQGMGSSLGDIAFLGTD